MATNGIHLVQLYTGERKEEEQTYTVTVLMFAAINVCVFVIWSVSQLFIFAFLLPQLIDHRSTRELNIV